MDLTDNIYSLTSNIFLLYIFFLSGVQGDLLQYDKVL